MSRPGTVVLLGYHAPPAAGVAARRIEAMVRHLPAFGWEPVVVAPRSPHHHLDEGAALEGARVVRTANPEPSRWLRGLLGGRPVGEGLGGGRALEPLSVGGAGSLLRRFVRAWLYVPDAHALWIAPASRAAVEVVRAATGPVVLYSTSVPYSAHLAARRAARAAGAAWVAEYRDPWSTAPPGVARLPALRRRLDRRLDRGVVRAADHVVVTCEATRAAFLRAFAELRPDGVSVVRNGWEERVEARRPGPDEPLTLAYAGTLLEPAWAEPLLSALARLHASRPGSVALEVLGPAEPWREAARRVEEAGAFLRLHGMVPGGEVAPRLAAASTLVILQSDALHYVPGKAYEYLGARRPIVALVPAGGEVLDLLARHGDPRLVEEASADAFARVIETLLSEHVAGTLEAPRVAWEVVEPLSRRAQAARLARVLDRVAGGAT